MFLQENSHSSNSELLNLETIQIRLQNMKAFAILVLLGAMLALSHCEKSEDLDTAEQFFGRGGYGGYGGRGFGGYGGRGFGGGGYGGYGGGYGGGFGGGGYGGGFGGYGRR